MCAFVHLIEYLCVLIIPLRHYILLRSHEAIHTTNTMFPGSKI